LHTLSVQAHSYLDDSLLKESLVVNIPGRIQALIDLLVSILKWGTER
jgi:hypothetical protein